MVHLLVPALVLTGAIGFAAASRRRPPSAGLSWAAAGWGLMAALWPAFDPAARAHLFDNVVWVFAVVICVLAVAHSSVTRARSR